MSVHGHDAAANCLLVLLK